MDQTEVIPVESEDLNSLIHRMDRLIFPEIAAAAAVQEQVSEFV